MVQHATNQITEGPIHAAGQGLLILFAFRIQSDQFEFYSDYCGCECGDERRKRRRGNGSGPTPVAISVDDVSIIVEEELKVHQAAPDCNAGGNTR